MQSTPTENQTERHSSEYVQSHEEVAQLMGHPLPSLCYLSATSLSDSTSDSTQERREEIDLFFQSLSRPILLFIYSNSASLSSSYFSFLNRDLISSWKGKEPDLEILALSAQTSAIQKHQLQLISSEPAPSPRSLVEIFASPTVASAHVNAVKLLSDSDSQFTNFLGLPAIKPSTSSIEGKSLKNLVLLLRGGQITRLYHPTLNDNPETISKRIWEMLIPDEDLA